MGSEPRSARGPSRQGTPPAWTGSNRSAERPTASVGWQPRTPTSYAFPWRADDQVERLTARPRGRQQALARRPVPGWTTQAALAARPSAPERRPVAQPEPDRLARPPEPARSSPTARTARRRSRRRGRALVILGSALAALALAGIFYPLWWQAREHRVASRLLEQALVLHPSTDPPPSGAAQAAVTSYCLGSANGAQGAVGVLDIPALHVVAPVVNGVTEADIAVAVGHDPASPWPGSPGESLLLAHDVSFFSRLSALKPGDEILFAKGCTLSRYRVLSSKVVKPGTLMPTPPGGAGLGLVTCWPTNALFWTPDRYTVQSALVSTGPITTQLPSPAGLPPVPKVDVAPALAARGVGLQQNEVPLGTLAIDGSPAASFSQGPGPLADERAVLHAYFAARKAALAGSSAWWSTLATRGVPLPRAWANRGPLSVHLDVSGVHLLGATAVAPDVSVRMVVQDGVLRVSDVSPR